LRQRQAKDRGVGGMMQNVDLDGAKKKSPAVWDVFYYHGSILTTDTV
jgi:hypothetical protein